MAAYTKPHTSGAPPCTPQEVLHWKNSVRISYFLRKLKEESKHSFSEQGMRNLSLSIFNIVMVLKGKMFILTLNPHILENNEKMKAIFYVSIFVICYNSV